MPACCSRCLFPHLPTLNSPHTCPWCLEKIHAVCVGLYLPDEPDISRNVVCMDCKPPNENSSSEQDKHPYPNNDVFLPPGLRRVSAKKPSPKRGKKLPAKTLQQTIDPNINQPVSRGRTNNPWLPDPKQLFYDADDMTANRVTLHAMESLDNPLDAKVRHKSPIPDVPDEPVFLSIPDSDEKKEKGNDEVDDEPMNFSVNNESVDDGCVQEPVVLEESSNYTFQIPYDISPDIDEMETLIRVCKHNPTRATKTNPNPSPFEKINKMIITFIYALAGATMTEENPRMAMFSLHQCLAQQAEDIFNNNCYKQKFVDGFLKYFYPVPPSDGRYPGLPVY